MIYQTGLMTESCEELSCPYNSYYTCLIQLGLARVTSEEPSCEANKEEIYGL